MRRQKYLCVLLAVMMFFVIASGGCGGGSSDGDFPSNRGNNNNDTPERTTPEATYDISALEGKWTASSSGTGTASGNGGTFDLRMIHVNASFSNVQVGSNSVTATASTSWEWDAYQNGRYVTTIYTDTNRESIEIRHIEGDTWGYTYPNGNTLTVIQTSATTASVTEEGTDSNGYRYTISYTMTKDDPDNPAMKYETRRLQGTWSASGGGGSASGNGSSFELRLSEGSSVRASNMQADGDTLTADLSGIIYWNVYYNGTRVKRVGLSYSRLEVNHLSGNTWRQWLTSDENLTMTLISQTEASIVEKGTIVIDGQNYKYSIVYTIKK